MAENLKSREKTWWLAVVVLVASDFGLIIVELLSKLSSWPLPSPSSVFLTILLADTFVICICVWQIKRLRKSSD